MANYRFLRRYIRLMISTRPTLYRAYAKMEGLQFRLDNCTQVIVDSYPRSANSFFEAAFSKAHSGQIRVAHHSHAAAQVLAAVRLELPCIVLIREPEAAIASFYEMNDGRYPIWLCTKEYITFYSALVPIIDKLIVLRTDSIETRFYDLMVLLRDQYQLSVIPYDIDPQTRDVLFKKVDETGRVRNGFAAERYSLDRSREEKDLRKRKLDSIRQSIIASPNSNRISQANMIYDTFKSHSF